VNEATTRDEVEGLNVRTSNCALGGPNRTSRCGLASYTSAWLYGRYAAYLDDDLLYADDRSQYFQIGLEDQTTRSDVPDFDSIRFGDYKRRGAS